MIGPKFEHWVKAFLPSYVRSYMFCNNLCESLNTCILKGRSQPIITLVESIRVSFNGEIVNRMNKMRRELENSVCLIIKKEN